MVLVDGGLKDTVFVGNEPAPFLSTSITFCPAWENEHAVAQGGPTCRATVTSIRRSDPPTCGSRPYGEGDRRGREFIDSAAQASRGGDQDWRTVSLGRPVRGGTSHDAGETRFAHEITYGLPDGMAGEPSTDLIPTA